MLSSHRRKTVIAAAALMATTALLTACQGNAEGSTKSSGAESSAAASSAKGTSDAKGTSSNGTGGAGSTNLPTGSGSGGGKAVSGTWFGNVSYLAPGKYTVSDTKGTEQAFFTSDDTDIEGAGEICGDAGGQAATPCSEAELEAAAKKGVSATVKLQKGIAVSIVEDHSSSEGGNDSGTDRQAGLHSGELGYLAPGKYSLDDNGSTIAFFTATDTTINGNGWICGVAGGKTKHCTEDELEAAAKKGGVRVVVDLDKGTAVTIDEEHN